MDPRPSILVITSSYPGPVGSGQAAAGAFVRDFARVLGRRARVTVLTQAAGAAPGRSQEDSLTVVRHPWRGGARPLSTLDLPKDFGLYLSVLGQGFRAAWQEAAAGDYDLILALWAAPAGLAALGLKLRFGLDYAVWALGSDIWDYGRRPGLRHVMALVLKKARARFADGFALAEEVRVLSGKDCAFLPSRRELPTALAPPAGLDPGRDNLLFIGRYHPNKGPDLLIEAMALLPEAARQKTVLHMFGGGSLEAGLKDRIDRLGLGQTVRLGSFIEPQEAANWLAHARGLVIPSRIESIPVVLSDALQAGCPLLVTDVGDMGQLVGSRRAGLVVRPQDPAALALAIGRFLQTPENEWGEGRAGLAALFDLEEAAGRVLALTGA